MKEIKLHIPSADELWYRLQLMSDADTNECVGVCINDLEHYYAYVVRCEDNRFIGEVSLYRIDVGYEDIYCMEIVLQRSYRGIGYSAEAIRQLLDVAFNELGAAEVCSEFENYKTSAVRAYIHAGFKYQEKGHKCRLSMSSKNYSSLEEC